LERSFTLVFGKHANLAFYSTLPRIHPIQRVWQV